MCVCVCVCVCGVVWCGVSVGVGGGEGRHKPWIRASLSHDYLVAQYHISGKSLIPLLKEHILISGVPLLLFAQMYANIVAGCLLKLWMLVQQYVVS